MSAPKTYECENCHGVFEETGTESERRAEYNRLWTPAERRGETARVCEPCFEKIMSWLKEHPEARAQ